MKFETFSYVALSVLLQQQKKTRVANNDAFAQITPAEASHLMELGLSWTVIKTNSF